MNFRTEMTDRWTRKVLETPKNLRVALSHIGLTVAMRRFKLILASWKMSFKFVSNAGTYAAKNANIARITIIVNPMHTESA